MNVTSLVSRRTLTRCKRTFVGFWLASLYVICVSAVVYSLSSFQIQNRLTSIPITSKENGEIFTEHKCQVPELSDTQVTLPDKRPSHYNDQDPLSDTHHSPPLISLSCIPNTTTKKVRYHTISKILPVIEQYNLISANIKLAMNTSKSLEQLIDETKIKIDSNEELLVIQQANAEIKARIDEIQKEVSRIGEAITVAKAHKENMHESIKKELEAAMISDQQSEEDLNILKRATEANTQKIEEEILYLTTAKGINAKKQEDEIRLLKAAEDKNIHRLSNELQFLNYANGEIIEQLKTLLADKNGLLDKHREFADILSSIEYYETFFTKVSDLLGTPPFWALPKSILTLLLVLSTGVLGSLIFVTVEFLKEPEYHIQNLSMYLFRPFLGMILALSMYVMLKAGQFTFVDDSSQNLSPFLVSFLGIISGMLAEEAYHRLTKTGGALINEKRETQHQ